jgi:hypothetical protein
LTGKEWKSIGDEGHDGDLGSVEATLLTSHLQGLFHGEDRMKPGRAGIILIFRAGQQNDLIVPAAFGMPQGNPAGQIIVFPESLLLLVNVRIPEPIEVFGQFCNIRALRQNHDNALFLSGITGIVKGLLGRVETDIFRIPSGRDDHNVGFFIDLDTGHVIHKAGRLHPG